MLCLGCQDVVLLLILTHLALAEPGRGGGVVCGAGRCGAELQCLKGLTAERARAAAAREGGRRRRRAR